VKRAALALAALALCGWVAFRCPCPAEHCSEPCLNCCDDPKTKDVVEQCECNPTVGR
jgi:hypothetical protein